MKARNTIILGVIAAALIALGYFYEQYLPSTSQLADIESHVLNFDRDKVKKIIVRNSEEKIVLEQKDHHWILVTPVKDRADDLVVAQLLTAADTLKKDSQIDLPEKKDDATNALLKDYGVAKTNVCLKLEGEDMPPELLVGKDTAIEGKMYVRLENSTDVFVVSTELKNQLTKKVDDFRAHTISDVDPKRVTELKFKTPDGEISLKNDGADWELKKPLQTRGDTDRINRLLAAIANTRIASFIPNQELGGIRGSIQWTTDSGTETLDIGQRDATDKDKVRARLSSRTGAYLLPKGIETLVTLKPNDLRDRHLLRVEMDIVDRIRIEPAGAPPIVLIRNKEEWQIEGVPEKPAGRAEVQHLVRMLQETAVTAFVTDAASELTKYGLDKPQLRVTFSSYSSENTPESTKGERPISSVVIGNEEGDNVYARIEEEPFIVSVPKALLAEIPRDAIAFKEPAILSIDPGKFATVVVRSGTRKSASIIRTGTGEWRLDNAGPGETLSEANAGSLVNTISRLRAARWIGATKPEHGLATPRVTVEATTSENKTYRLALGTQDPNGMVYASLDGEPGTFLLSKPDAEALSAPLLVPPQPNG